VSANGKKAEIEAEDDMINFQEIHSIEVIVRGEE
jgi:hypothetical protein